MIAHDNDSLEKKLICISEVCILKKKKILRHLRHHTNENHMPEDAENSLGMNNIPQ